MKTTMLKILTASLICFQASLLHTLLTRAKPKLKNKFECVQKQQGEWVSYNHNGVTFNGTCQPNENGKLQFKVPAP